MHNLYIGNMNSIKEVMYHDLTSGQYNGLNRAQVFEKVAELLTKREISSALTVDGLIYSDSLDTTDDVCQFITLNKKYDAVRINRPTNSSSIVMTYKNIASVTRVYIKWTTNDLGENVIEDVSTSAQSGYEATYVTPTLSTEMSFITVLKNYSATQLRVYPTYYCASNTTGINPDTKFADYDSSIWHNRIPVVGYHRASSQYYQRFVEDLQHDSSGRAQAPAIYTSSNLPQNNVYMCIGIPNYKTEFMYPYAIGDTTIAASIDPWFRKVTVNTVYSTNHTLRLNYDLNDTAFEMEDGSVPIDIEELVQTLSKYFTRI
jgi:hypothetical protein